MLSTPGYAPRRRLVPSIVVAPIEAGMIHVARAGMWSVSVSCGELRSGPASVDVSLGAESVAVVRWGDADGVALSGRVIRDGRGIGGERVNLWLADEVIQFATSGDDGNFELRSVPNGHHVLTAGGSDRHAQSPVEVVVAGVPVRGLELESAALAAARVRVVQSDGTPCPNAQVRVRGTRVSHACRTDDLGVCRMLGLAAGRTEFFVPTDDDIETATDSAEALASASVQLAGGATIDVVLRLPERRGEVSGTVRLDGATVPGVRLTLRRDDDGGDDGRVWASATSDADGGFRLAGLSPGRYTLRAAGPTRASSTIAGVSPGEVVDVALTERDEGALPRH